MKKIMVLISVIFLSMFFVSIGIGCKVKTVETTATTETTAAETITVETTAVETTTVKTLSTEPVTLHIILEQSSGDLNKIHNKIFDDFMKLYPNVTIDAQVYEFSDLNTKIRNAIAAGGPLDGFMTYCFDAAWYIENNTLAEIDPSIFDKTVEEYVSAWIPSAFTAAGVEFKGKYYGVPFSVANYLGFVNKKHMIAAGLDPEKDIPKTWDEAREIGKKMTIVKNGKTIQDGFYEFIGAWDKYILSSMFQQKGLDWQSLDGMIAACDTPEAVGVLKTYTDVVVVDKSMDPATYDPQLTPLSDGTASMFFWGGPWMFGLIKAGGGNPDDYIAFKYPRFADGLDKGGMSYGSGLFLSNLSKNPDWTLKFFDYWTSQSELYVSSAIYLPRADFDAKAAFGPTTPYWDVFSEEFPKATPSIIDTRVAEIEDAVLKAESRVVYDGMSAEESIKALKSDLETIKNK